jgi:hypothetical protein
VFNCLRNGSDFGASTVVSGRHFSFLVETQIQLDSVQIELVFAHLLRLRFSAGSRKVSYAKCLDLPESVRADSNRAGMTQIETRNHSGGVPDSVQA